VIVGTMENGSRAEQTMKEDFAYSKRMHCEKTVKPARRKARKEMAISLGFLGAYAFLVLERLVLHWF
jgi:hypothetical protein